MLSDVVKNKKLIFPNGELTLTYRKLVFITTWSVSYGHKQTKMMPTIQTHYKAVGQGRQRIEDVADLTQIAPCSNCQSPRALTL